MSEKYLALQKKIISIMDIADRTGYNSSKLKEYFEKTTENEFMKHLANPDFKFRLIVEEYDHEPVYRHLIEACDKCGAIYQEQFIIDRKEEYVSDHKHPSLILPVPRLQQKGETESASSSETTKKNHMGHVIGDNKGAQFSDIEMMGALASGRKKTVTEMNKVRSGSEEVKRAVYNELLRTGNTSMDDKVLAPEDRKEVAVIRSMYYGMNMRVDM